MDFTLPQKFGIIAFPSALVFRDVPAEVRLSDEFYISRTAPFRADTHWEEWLGSINADKLRDAKLHLISHGPSSSPYILDAESELRTRHVNYLFLALLMTGPVQTFHRPITLSASLTDEGPNVRQMGYLEEYFDSPGSPTTIIDVPRLELAGKISKVFCDLPKMNSFTRLYAFLEAFRRASCSHSIEDRIHQFVRCVDGIILSRIGSGKRDFVARTSFLIGSGFEEVLRTLYDIRSAIEHLHDSRESVPGNDRRSKLLFLFQKSYEAESIARLILLHVLRDLDYAKKFLTHQNLESFWSLPEDERRELWGPPLDFTTMSVQFDSKLVREYDYGENDG